MFQGGGYEIARSIWPDSILSEPPKHLQQEHQHSWRSTHHKPRTNMVVTAEGMCGGVNAAAAGNMTCVAEVSAFHCLLHVTYRQRSSI